jgi:hypothetical protein
MIDDYYEGEVSHVVLLKNSMLKNIKQSLIELGLTKDVQDQIDLFEKTFNWNLSISDLFPPSEESS